MVALGFFLRFALIAPVCLVVWWLAMPYYGWILGHVTALFLQLFGEPIDSVQIEQAGVLNTESLLKLLTGPRTRSIVIGYVVANMAPFVALVLSTSGLGVRRRLRVLGAGIGILVASHVIYLLWAILVVPAFQDTPHIPIVVVQLFLTLPFLLWIVLAYWRQIAGLLRADNEAPVSGEEPSAIETRMPPT